MNESNVTTNSLKAWFLAARPKTLPGAAVPVMIGIASAISQYGDAVRVGAAVLCMLFALVMQIDANFVNDYFDFMKGTDDEKRLGPKRACAQGWITAVAMRRGLLYTTLLACVIGLPLVYYGGWEMILIGFACVVFCFLYTISFSYLGLWRRACARVLRSGTGLHDLLARGSTYSTHVYPAFCNSTVYSLWTHHRHSAYREQL